MVRNTQMSIVIPVFNEGQNIVTTLRNIQKELIYTYEIIIVYDFEKDDTIQPVQSYKKGSRNIKLAKNKYGKGVINAVKTGIMCANGQAVVIMSPDLSDDPKTLNGMYRYIRKGYDIVCATRYTKGGQRINQGSIKMLLSKLAGISTPFLLGIPVTDLTNGFKMYRKSIFTKISIESQGGWEFAAELIIKAYDNNFSIYEIPTVSRNRKHGKSKFKLFTWLPYYLKWYCIGMGKNLLRRFK